MYASSNSKIYLARGYISHSEIFPSGDSPYGCWDMVSNTWEWIGSGAPAQLRTPLRSGDLLDDVVEAQTFHIRMHNPRQKTHSSAFAAPQTQQNPTSKGVT